MRGSRQYARLYKTFERLFREQAAGEARAAAEAAKLARAHATVSRMSTYRHELVTLHRTASQPIDWAAYVTAQPSATLQYGPTREAAACEALAGYAPSLFARMTGRAQRQRSTLERAVAASREADAAEHEQRRIARERTALAQRVLVGEPAALLAAVEAADPFGALTKLGKEVRLSAPRPYIICAEFDVHIKDVVPRDVPRLTKRAQVAIQTMSDHEFHRTYQDHVCSAMLRIARELFALVPIDSVIVTACDQVRDGTTGEFSYGALLSVLFSRGQFLRLDFESLDPSDTIEMFEHRMSFDLRRGFSRIEPLPPVTAVP